MRNKSCMVTILAISICSLIVCIIFFLNKVAIIEDSDSSAIVEDLVSSASIEDSDNSAIVEDSDSSEIIEREGSRRITLQDSDLPIPIDIRSFEVNELASGSFVPSAFKDESMPPAVQWQYIRSDKYLEKLSKDYGFPIPTNLDLENHSYIVSFGCKIVEIWAVEKQDEDLILNITYSAQYQGEQVFFYELPKVKIYPFKWPSFILKDGNRVPFATDPRDCDETLLEGYL